MHPKVIQQAFRQGCNLLAYSDVFNDSEFFKTESLGTELLGGGVVLDGCQWSGRNVCRQSPDIAAIDRVVRILYKTTAHYTELLHITLYLSLYIYTHINNV